MQETRDARVARVARIASHRDLMVWGKGMDLVEQVYGLTRTFPSQEQFRLVGQATRAAVGVPANIAEGHARSSRREYAHFVAIARGSLMELETHLMIAKRLGYITDAQADSPLQLITELSKMLMVLRHRLLEPEAERKR